MNGKEQSIPAEVREAIHISDGLVCIEYDKGDMGKAAYVLHTWRAAQGNNPPVTVTPVPLTRATYDAIRGHRPKTLEEWRPLYEAVKKYLREDYGNA